MEKRVFNFSAGPAMLPLEVLQASAQAMLDYKGKGYGIAEISHRGKDFDAVLDEAISRCRSLVGIPDTYDILFLQGGATQLFTTIPMNFMQGSADFVVTGEWAKKAAEAAKPFGTVNVLASSKKAVLTTFPPAGRSPRAPATCTFAATTPSTARAGAFSRNIRACSRT